MANHVGDTWQAMCHVSQCMAKACMCDTWHAMCQHAWHFESYKYGSSNSVRGGSSKEKEEEGKREREEKKSKGKKERIEEKGGREKKERGKGRSVAQ